jgi:hypothetical protein
MLIPNAENAVVDIRKLRDYCLNSEHDDGKHKARLFSSILGMTADDAEKLRQILLEVVTMHEARLGRQDEFGQRYTVGDSYKRDYLLPTLEVLASGRRAWGFGKGFPGNRLRLHD